MDLVSIDSNPIPPGGSLEMVRTRDAITLRGAYWPATAQAVKGTVCLMQGRAEFIEKYFETINDLRRRGFGVFTFDWRGQGGSQRLLPEPRKGYVGSYDDYAVDLRAVIDRMEQIGAPKPFVGVAHSMGGTATLIALARGEKRLQRCLLSAPFIGIYEGRAPRWASWAAEALGLFGGKKAYIPGGGGTSVMTKPFAGNFLSSDADRYARTSDILAVESHLGIGDPTVGWIRASYRAFAEIERLDFGFRFETPLLFVIAGADTLVSSRAAEALAQRVKGAWAVNIPHARHELMMEQDDLRSQFFAALDAFLPGEQVSPAKATLSAT